MLAAAWASPLIVEDKVYIGDEDGDICVFELSAEHKAARRNQHGKFGLQHAGSGQQRALHCEQGPLFAIEKQD